VFPTGGLVHGVTMSDTGRRRSVNDYASEQTLKEALTRSPGTNTATTDPNEPAGFDIPPAATEELDWFIPNVDAETSETQTVFNEMRRLFVLKSYNILDKEVRQSRETSLDRLISLASRIFDVPMAFVSIIDLGRAIFLASCGLPVDDEVPRKGAFCAHAVLTNQDIFIVPDTSKDVRFKEHPGVTGPMHVRFYAACPLHAPEGYKIGVFGICGTKSRPNGMTPKDKESLRDLAGLAMEEIARYRTIQQQRKERITSSQLLASVAHDLMTPLTGVQLSLSSLGNDKSFQDSTAEYHKESIATASSCADVMAQICETLRSNHDVERNGSSQTSSPSPSDEEAPVHPFHIERLVYRLHRVLDTLPKAVPMVISVDSAVPEKIVGNELVMMRAALNLLVYCCDRAKTGSVRMTIRLRVSCKPGQELFFECEVSVAKIEPQLLALLVDPSTRSDASVELNGDDEAASANYGSTIGLETAMTQIRLLHGDAGIVFLEKEKTETDVRSLPTTRFWFSVPICLPDKPIEEASENRVHAVQGDTLTVPPSRQRRALVIDDSTVVRKSLARALSQLGYETAQAVDGMEGLKQMQNFSYDLVLCDFLMPVMDGLDCVRAYRKWEEDNRPCFRMYIVGISAHASAGCVSRALSLGMNGYRAKPITIDTLKDLALSADSLAMTSCLDKFEYATDEKLATCKVRRRSTDRDEKVCLVLSGEGSVSGIRESLSSRGWHAVVACNDKEALCLMKERNWGMVILDGEEAGLSGPKCVAEFRDWEQHNRVRRQRHVYLLSADFRTDPSASGSISVAQLPTGVDGAISKPVKMEDLETVLANIEEISTFDANDIVV